MQVALLNKIYLYILTLLVVVSYKWEMYIIILLFRYSLLLVFVEGCLLIIFHVYFYHSFRLPFFCQGLKRISHPYKYCLLPDFHTLQNNGGRFFLDICISIRWKVMNVFHFGLRQYF